MEHLTYYKAVHVVGEFEKHFSLGQMAAYNRFLLPCWNKTDRKFELVKLPYPKRG